MGIELDERALTANRGGRTVQLLIAIVAVMTVAKTLLALNTYGTNDVFRNELFMIWSRELGVGLYRAAWDFNHPGFIIHWLQFLGFLENKTGLPFSFWFRFHSIPADIGIVWITWRLLGDRVRDPTYSGALLMLAAAPVLLLVSGFHGNTDSMMIFFLLLSIYLAEQGSGARAGAAFGMAMCFKVVPIVVLPMLLLNLTGKRSRIEFSATAAALILVGWAPFIFQDPVAVGRQVFGYRSYYGHWGLSYFASQFAPAALNSLFREIGSFVQLGAVAALSFWMSRLRPRPPLAAQAGAAFLLFLAISPGFGVQYLVWIAPFAVWLGAGPAALFFATSGVFLLLVYNYWSGGFPWYLADSIRVGDYQGHLDKFQVIAWLTIVALLLIAVRRLREPSWLPAPLARPAFVLGLILLLAVPLQRQLARDRARGERIDGRRAAREIRANTYFELAARLDAAGRNRDAARARGTALSLR